MVCEEQKDCLLMRTLHLQSKNTTGLKRANRAAVLDLMLQHQQISRQAISEYTGLSSPTVTNIMHELLDEDIVRKVGVSTARSEGAGRRRELLELNPQSRLALAIHLGSPESALGLIDVRGRVVASEIILSDYAAIASEENLRQVIVQARAFMASHDVPPTQFLGIGVGIPGIPWGEAPVEQILRREFGVPVMAINNVRAMALGEYVFGLNKEIQDLVFVYIGKGIGTGIISDGELLRGAADRAGEIGHLWVTDEPIVCRCGNTGCLETVISEAAIAEQVRSLFPALAASDDLIAINHLIEAATTGDEQARVLLHEVGQYLGRSLTSVMNIVEPRLIVLGGRLVQVGPLLLEPLQQVIRQRAHTGIKDLLEVRPSVLGADVSLIGAAALLLVNRFYSPQFTLSGEKEGVGFIPH
jgi:N-acetylglucosamine repressor